LRAAQNAAAPSLYPIITDIFLLCNRIFEKTAAAPHRKAKRDRIALQYLPRFLFAFPKNGKLLLL
jgi:hypothetical protein